MADSGEHQLTTESKQNLILTVYRDIAEELHALFNDWPPRSVARAWEVQRHFSHRVALVNVHGTDGQFLYCEDCNETLPLNIGHELGSSSTKSNRISRLWSQKETARRVIAARLF